MNSTKIGEKREWKRLSIDCPVILKISSRGRAAALVSGHLLDIGMGGARLQVGQHLQEGSRVVLHTHFRDDKQNVTTVHFEGIVQRADDQPVYEVAVQFHRSGRIIRQDVGDLLLVPSDKVQQPKNGKGRGRKS
ncbi:MAG: PilZ domain-containing protein [Acidobacteria bacterium]|nr:PilZ domain-containing protein [Acidobacteriota bacterium]